MKAGRCIASYAIALGIAASATPRAAQADKRPLPPYIDPGACVWEEVFPTTPPPEQPALWLGSGPRVAVVVWEDMTIANPADRLYLTLFEEINTYAQDVADAGFSVAVFKFYGMAEDPVGDPDPENPMHDLRWELRYLLVHGGLAGAALLGNCPYILYEDGTRDFESDFLLGDLDCSLEDNLHDDASYRRGVFDTWSGAGGEGGEMDIWICRIMARPSLIGFLNAHPGGGSWTEQLILQRYFTRNHQLRWRAFDAHANALLFAGCESDCADPLPEMQDVFGGPVTLDIVASPEDIEEEGWAPADVYLDDLASESYTHVYHNNFHGDQRKQFILDTDPGSEWHGYPYTYTVWREHYVQENFQPGSQPAHPGCANSATLTYVFDTCANGSYGYYPDDWDPTTGACCQYPDLPVPCEVLEHWDCVYRGGSFHEGASCDDCPAWSPEWPLPGDEPCIAEVAAFNPNSAGPGYEHGAALSVLASTAWTDAFVYDMPSFYGALLDHGCLGDGMRALYNIHATGPLHRRFVLLGDATLKSGLRWKGEPDDPIEARWSIADNWTGGVAPESDFPESLVHDNADVIQVNVGTTDDAFYIRRFFGDGAGGGGLRILSDKHLEATQDVVLSAGYPITLEASELETTVFSVGATLSGGNVILMESTQLTAGQLQDSALTVGGGSVTVENVSGTGDWNLTGCNLYGGAASDVAGEWEIEGGETDFGEVGASRDHSLQMKLDGGAELYLREVRYEEPAQGIKQPFPDGPLHTLSYGAGANSVAAGTQVAGSAFYIGTDSVIGKVIGATDPSLSLDLHCSLRIATSQRETWPAWDSSAVNVVIEPIASGPQTIELISAPTPAAFADTPSHGRFATLTLPAGSAAAVVSIADAYNNRSPATDAERGIFETVVVGAGRVLRFPTYPPKEGETAHKIYYYGATPVIEGTIQDRNGASISPALVIQPVPYTYYGDWSPANCVITNVELAQLHQAIAGGPSHYVAYMDFNSDGLLNNFDLAKFMTNYASQPGCASRQSGLDGGETDESAMRTETIGDELADEEPPPDVSALAFFLIEQLSPEELAAFVAQASVTAAEHADDAIGAEMMELLSYLP